MGSFSNKKVILILGAASVTGRSFARGLRLSQPYRDALLIGGDIFNDIYTFAENLFDILVRVPRYDDSNHEKVLRNIIEKYRIEACVVLAELEVSKLADVDLGIPMLLPSRSFCKIAANKSEVFTKLAPHGYAPRHINKLNFERHEDQLVSAGMDYPVWVRSSDAGTTSGRDSYLAQNPEELHTWFTISKQKELQAAEYLPGKNWACLMLYRNGRLHSFGIYERISYVMSNVAPSGVTGNISVGQITHNPAVLEVSTKSVEVMETHAGTKAQGFLVVDLKESTEGRPLVTEINLKPVACVGSFSHPRFNLASGFIDLTVGENSGAPAIDELVDQYVECYQDTPYILRDVDGEAVLVDSIDLPQQGDEIKKPKVIPWSVLKTKRLG